MKTKFKPVDLVFHHACHECSSPVDLHAVPLGDPLYFLKTGYCYSCGTSCLSVDAIGPTADVQKCILDLVGNFLHMTGKYP